MGDTRGFYDNLTAFSSFSEVVDQRHYVRVPEDWSVLITDVKGSTKAIAENRYKEVNMAGAATITATLNTLKGRKIPFVFGGDGATFLVHDSDLGPVTASLAKTSAMVKKAYDLELRIGHVSIADLSSSNALVEVAKFGVSEKSSLAMIRGGGVAVAEKWIKGGDSRARAIAPAEGLADVEGLSCRWNPIPAKRGEMLSILVLARGSSESASETYKTVLQELETLFGPGDESHPVTEAKLDHKVSLKTLSPELKLRAKVAELGIVHVIKAYLGSLALRFLYKSGLKLAFFDAREYVSDLAKNTDFRKFDDMLRMVRECDRSQRERLEAYLETLRREGRIHYGLHASKEALMTCMVFSAEDHVHFIDGGGGGYALAAKMLKAQMTSPGTELTA